MGSALGTLMSVPPKVTPVPQNLGGFPAGSETVTCFFWKIYHTLSEALVAVNHQLYVSLGGCSSPYGDLFLLSIDFCHIQWELTKKKAPPKSPPQKKHHNKPASSPPCPKPPITAPLGTIQSHTQWLSWLLPPSAGPWDPLSAHNIYNADGKSKAPPLSQDTSQ
ncbi:hypothetical protein DSO57_1025462 [Entomophthora muscae]|uniref:Uncharacterized protein n=1 Tax=Entomophthora muscae TaxID=34485 RepID=A0ACC2UNF2_9FUNG|nr:hypothetical protein DSO57_1025462 [Entomophthora muscae]